MSDVQDQPLDVSHLFEIGTDYFSVFSFPSAFEIDLRELKSRYLALQQQSHPDRYANAPASEQRQAVQRTAYLNQAFETLKSPLKRAVYMLEQVGIGFDTDAQTHTDISFLTAQLELREQLEALGDAEDPFADLDQLDTRAQQEYVDYQAEFVTRYSEQNWNLATQSIHKMMFASKLLEEIRLKEEVLES